MTWNIFENFSLSTEQNVFHWLWIRSLIRDLSSRANSHTKTFKLFPAQTRSRVKISLFATISLEPFCLSQYHNLQIILIYSIEMNFDYTRVAIFHIFATTIVLISQFYSSRRKSLPRRLRWEIVEYWKDEITFVFVLYNRMELSWELSMLWCLCKSFFRVLLTRGSCELV